MLNPVIKPLCILGCGDVFESLRQNLSAYGWDSAHVFFHGFDGVDALAGQADGVIAQWSPQTHDLFLAVDSNAMNHARLELYGRARLKGFRMVSLVHNKAHVDQGVHVADNVWVGPGALLSHGCRIESNTFIHANARLDARVQVASHVWIAPGARLGADSVIGAHSIVGADVILKPATQFGHHVVIEAPGSHGGEWASGTFLESTAEHAAMMIGPGYTFTRQALK
jgi:acetyltransferase-like isoleucine patch superfamily enzyme